jgi:hypothetical protein
VWAEIHNFYSFKDRALLPLLGSRVAAMKPLFIELFSGSKTTSQQFQDLGFETFTIDIDFEPDLVKDMMCVDCGDFAHLDLASRPLVVVWASPPCKAFSLANTHNHHFAPGGKPLTEKAIEGIDMVKKTIELIQMINPHFWFLENPYTGFLRHQKFMKKYHMVKVLYCQYGSEFQKPTSIWGEFPSAWIPKGTCHCHSHASMWSDASNYPGKKYGEMGFDRAIVPAPLGRELAEACLISPTVMFPSLAEWV